MKLPTIIQGGMGVAISSWQLANAVASQGQIGVVSGTALDLVFTRRLQDGDPGGHMRRAIDAFPDQALAQPIRERYFIPGGKPHDQPYLTKPVINHKLTPKVLALLVVANFAEVFLAKENHTGLVGVNYLHKVQLPLMPSLLGAMLAGVDLVIVGAGIPMDLPPLIDALCQGQPFTQTLHVPHAADPQAHQITFNPKDLLPNLVTPMKRPLFFPVIASATLAAMLAKRCKGKIDGLIIEGPSAGGHNAPPRGPQKLTVEGEPLYGPRDDVKLDAIKKLNIPFYLAGSFGSPEKLTQALADGAAGVQVGSLFAFCNESGLRDDLKNNALQQCKQGSPSVFQDPVASPTGFPFQVLAIPDTLSDRDLYEKRDRICDLAYLREAYQRDNGSLGWRCPSEPTDAYLAKGGKLENTQGRKCLCNALFANIGQAQHRRKNHADELPLATSGNDLASIPQLLAPGQTTYTAQDVLHFLLNQKPAHTPPQKHQQQPA